MGSLGRERGIVELGLGADDHATLAGKLSVSQDLTKVINSGRSGRSGWPSCLPAALYCSFTEVDEQLLLLDHVRLTAKLALVAPT